MCFHVVLDIFSCFGNTLLSDFSDRHEIMQKTYFFAQDQSILTNWNSRNYFGLDLDVLKKFPKNIYFYNFVESNSLLCFCYIFTFLDLLVSYI